MALSYEGLNGSKYRCWFKFVDKDEDGRITGQEAKSLFPRAELQQKALATIWAMADFKRSGFLDFPAFCKAMDLISMAQEGKDLTEAEYQRSRLTVDAPQMKGLDAEVGDMASVGDNPFGDVQDTSAGKGKGKGTNVTLGKKKVAITSVVDGLKEIYFSRLHALEDTYKCAPPLYHYHNEV